MWSWKYWIIGAGLVALVIVAPDGTLYVLTSVGEFVGGVVQQIYAGLNAFVFQPVRRGVDAAVQFVVPRAARAGVRGAALAAGASPEQADAAADAAQQAVGIAAQARDMHNGAARRVAGIFRAGVGGMAGLAADGARAAAGAVGIASSAPGVVDIGRGV